jgi:hypothetical protein
MAIGCERFKQEIEELNGQRLTPVKIARPKKNDTRTE